MTLITFFTAPKPFVDPHISTIQKNAIRSWKALGPEVEVFLVGDEKGLAEAAQELQVGHLPQVALNEKGTPLVSSIFELARQASQAPLLAYLNADIIAMSDMLLAAKRAAQQAEKFLLVGQRWDLDVHAALDFSAGWEERLRERVQRDGQLHAPAGSDYFIFPRHLYADMPDFAVGRAGWDNWTIFHAVQQGWAAIDATQEVCIVHQNHDYSHLPGGKPHYTLDESMENIEKGGGLANMYIILDTNRQLRDGKVVPPKYDLNRLIRKAEIRLTPAKAKSGWKHFLSRRLRRLRRAVSGTN